MIFTFHEKEKEKEIALLIKDCEIALIEKDNEKEIALIEKGNEKEIALIEKENEMKGIKAYYDRLLSSLIQRYMTLTLKYCLLSPP